MSLIPASRKADRLIHLDLHYLSMHTRIDTLFLIYRSKWLEEQRRGNKTVGKWHDHVPLSVRSRCTLCTYRVSIRIRATRDEDHCLNVCVCTAKRVKSFIHKRFPMPAACRTHVALFWSPEDDRVLDTAWAWCFGDHIRQGECIYICRKFS